MKPNFRYDSRYQLLKKQNMQEAIEFILEHNYGDTMSFGQLSTILGYNIDDKEEKMKFRSMMGRIKNFLIEYGYILKGIAGVGYYILKPKQISGYCYHTYIRHTEDLLSKSNRILKNVDKSELSDIRTEEYNSICELNKDVFDNIDNTIDVSKYMQKKSYYDNLED